MVSAETESIPDLVGNWTGTSVGHMKQSGYEGSLGYNYTLSIEEQKGRTFNGTLYIFGPDYNGSTGFSAAIGHDMKNFYMPQYDQGMNFGEIISQDEIEIIYAVTGKNGAALIESFIREK
ncbi:MAG: hypothetical protein CVV33_00610 [Methanomicrobiales archaeon HGW-Methanomicrobiales-4]|nr:MAG: hypothetical protein CVV33_00610 [Methanomicrobiales archaeon HGW-Methanomicrobiales-4]